MTLSLPDLYWLAGFLEGEGSFLRPVPSSPNRCIIQVAGTDEDVIARVAAMFKVSIYRGDPKPGVWKPYYRVVLRGHRARALMIELRPLMGVRRQGQIDRAMAGQAPLSRPHNLKLSDDDVAAIRGRRGDSARSVAAEYGVSRSLIHHIWEGTRRPVAQR